ncbi:response regulator transcription factor [Paraglaciecola hydrolytica]|uniref:Two-component system response regulator n=1 Tax=Paraglaciecola hydrolytica TaxID=1799789 RepID=A0A136A1L4_9ALTE|nr:response regulator [Paraglaciecola hydrolytica]KXI29087.1 two-component system response regulator [Paraglaciecola hydrolytica]
MSQTAHLQTLLLIEDEQAFANILLIRLSRQGYQCHHADTVEAGIKLASELSPQYVVVDMKIGNDNSLPHITALRALLPQAKIVLLTGYASIATAVEAIKNGADDYLAKPVDTAALIAALEGKQSAVSSEQTISTARLEWEHIQQTLKTNDGNISVTARQLGMHRRTLQRKLVKKPKGENG